MENKEFVKNYIRVEKTKNIPRNWLCWLFGHHPRCRRCDPKCETELLIKKKDKNWLIFHSQKENETCWCFSLLICVCERQRERKEGPHCVCVCERATVRVWKEERERVSELTAIVCVCVCACVCASERVCEWLCVCERMCVGVSTAGRRSDTGEGEKRMKISSKAE